ncbi:MAG: hypothetical protein L3J46_11780 [Kangiellaceae bacterium]|nr:hypothetical protein [Kangiellaceae bacterium]
MGQELQLKAVINSHLIVLNLDNNSIFSAGEYKIKFPKLSLADAILITLSKKVSSIILTTEKLITEIKKVNAIKLNY